jgi:hypothetical protein
VSPHVQPQLTTTARISGQKVFFWCGLRCHRRWSHYKSVAWSPSRLRYR